jgi:hypothetical protein
LLEPQRTNDIPYSEWFGYSGWSKIRCTITDNYAISPEGFQNAALMTATGDDARLEEAITLSGDYTQSIWVKSGQSGDVAGQIDFAGIAAVTFTANQEWQRVETTADSFHRVRIRITNSGDKLLVYGAQLEAGSYATSYIPTYGSAVTRNADAASKTGISDLINDSEGTLFVEASTLENGADCRITISDNTINNRVSIEWDANADTIKGFIGVGGNLQTTSYDQTNMNKIALVYNATDARLFINGTKVFTDSSVPSLSGMDRLEFSNYAAALPFVGNTNKLLILKEKLTDQEAIDLTTI